MRGEPPACKIGRNLQWVVAARNDPTDDHSPRTAASKLPDADAASSAPSASAGSSLLREFGTEVDGHVGSVDEEYVRLYMESSDDNEPTKLPRWKAP